MEKCASGLCHSRYRSFSGNDLPLGRAASRDPSGSIRNHMDPGDRLYNQISDPSDQRESPALMSQNLELEEAVRACSRGKALWQRVLLLCWYVLFYPDSFLIFVHLTELTLSSMLASAGTKTIGLTIFNFQQSGDYNLSAAMSAVIVVMVLTGYCLEV